MKKSFKAFLILFVAALLIAAVFAPVAFAASSDTGDDLPDLGAFSVRDGRVFKNDTEIDCQVYEMPEGITSVVERWAVFGADTSDAVTENETGVWFIGGMYDYFIHLDSEHEYQDLLWCPSGGTFILVLGNESGAEVTYQYWGIEFGDEESTSMTKKAEFTGVRGEIGWLPDEGLRFVYTRIDGARDAEDGAYDPYALKLSAVVYDPSVKEEVVLKEATDKQNFRFSGFSDEGIVIIEETVESEKDWGQEGFDEGKIKEREITVEIPAAG
jgi:hypothetical protein